MYLQNAAVSTLPPLMSATMGPSTVAAALAPSRDHDVLPRARAAATAAAPLGSATSRARSKTQRTASMIASSSTVTISSTYAWI